MFRLVNYRDSVEIRPYEFGKDLDELFIKKLNSKYIDKIIEGVGLVICISEIIRRGKGIIIRTRGSAIYKIDFKIAVFSPFKHQIIRGVISHSDINGIRVSLGFYDDIHVVPMQMKKPINYDDKTGTWIIDNGDKVVYNVGSEIKVKIINVLYNSSTADKETPPMIIIASTDY